MQLIENPIRLNWELCVKLHNQIIDISWERSRSTTTRDNRTWWEFYESGDSPGLPSEIHPQLSMGEALTRLEKRLPDELVWFLKGAKLISGGRNERNYFFYNCFDLTSPFKIIDYLN